MDYFFSKYGWTVMEVLAGVISVSFLFGITKNSDIVDSKMLDALPQQVVTETTGVAYALDEIDEDSFTVTSATLEQNTPFNWRDYVTAYSKNGISLAPYITVSGNIDTSVTGVQRIAYIISWNGETSSRTGTYVIQGGYE